MIAEASRASAVTVTASTSKCCLMPQHQKIFTASYSTLSCYKTIFFSFLVKSDLSVTLMPEYDHNPWVPACQ